MRIPRAVLAALLAVPLAPTAGAAQPQPAGVPEIRAQGADDPLLQSSFGTISFTVDRPTYAAVFELARDGRVRVLYPARPSDTARVEPSRRYRTKAWSPDMLVLPAVSTLSALGDPVPFSFVVTSERPLDLSAFGTGKRWARQLMPPNPDARPEAVIASIADRVVAKDASYDWDYAYLAPRLTARQQIVLMQCTSPGAFRRDDFWGYHALWGLAATEWFRYPRAGLFFTTYYSPAFGAPSFWFQTVGSCYAGPQLPVYAFFPPRVTERVAYAPTMRPPMPTPADTAHTPGPSTPPARGPQRPLDAIPGAPGSEAPIRTGDWREDASAPTRRPTPRTSVPGGLQPKDPLPSAKERLAQWKAERLAKQPQHADEAVADRAEEIARLIRAYGLTEGQAAFVAARPGHGGSEAARRRAASAASGRSFVTESYVTERSGRSTGVAEPGAGSGSGSVASSAARSPATGEAPRSAPVPAASAPSASSAAQANAPGRASGDAQRRVQ